MTGPDVANPLVVAPEDEHREPWDSLEGAGVFSSFADLNEALAAGSLDGMHIAFTTAGAGLDLLGAVMDPLGALGEAGVGWAIEHFALLHEPLDALAGDPAQITAQAQTWQNVAEQLAAVAADLRGATAGGAPDWDGAAADAYRGAAAGFSARLDEAAAGAGRLAELVLNTGAAVGTVRAVLRDLVAQFVWWVLTQLALYGVLAFFTYGGALAAGAVRLVLRAVELGTSMARRVGTLALRLADSSATAEELAERLVQLDVQISAGMSSARAALRPIDEAAAAVPAAEVIEAGTQFTGLSQEREGRPQPVPI